jgi:putative ABC transport system permease protein
VFSLTIVLAVSAIGKNMIFEEIQSFGINRVWVFRDLNELYNEPNPDLWTSNRMLTNGDVENLAEFCRDIRLLAPSFRHVTEVVCNGKTFSGILLIGAGSNWGIIHGEQLESGRFIAPLDEKRRNLVCVLSSKAAKSIFGDFHALGKRLQINNEYLTIVGILKNNERPLLESIRAVPARQETIIIPYTVMQGQNWYNTRNVEFLDFRVTSFDKITRAAEDIKNYFHLKYGNRHQFEVKMLYDEIKRAKRIMRILSVMLGILAGIAMLIAGFGIANIMLASVTERFHEIGIRRAVGATRKDILFQFIAEATVVGFLGGMTGILAVLGIAFFGTLWFDLSKYSLWPAVLISSSLSVLTGMLAGVYPATRAADLNPVAALSRV